MKRLAKDTLIGENLISCSKKYIEGNYIPHFHDFYEIEYVISGSGMCTINGEKLTCTDGTLFFITPVDYHSVQTGGAEIFNIMFSEQLINFKLLEPFVRHSAPKAITVDSRNRLFFEQIFTEIVENENNIEYSSSLVNCLLLKLVQLLPKTANDNISDNLSKIHSYIINNYRKKITLDTVAAYVGLTPNYVSALFKNEMHIGFKSYLNSLRLEYARKLLVFTEQPIKQICEESGFDDLPNFIKRFKAYYGMTPSSLRKNTN